MTDKLINDMDVRRKKIMKIEKAIRILEVFRDIEMKSLDNEPELAQEHADALTAGIEALRGQLLIEREMRKKEVYAAW